MSRRPQTRRRSRSSRRAFERTSADVQSVRGGGPGGVSRRRRGGRGGSPRKRGADDRVEAEKRKRANAQNGRGAVEWKSEAEMALRQQYD